MSFVRKLKMASLAAALALAAGTAPAAAQNKKVVLSQAFQSMLYLPLYVAINKGYFTEEGLDLVKETAGSPTAALSAVISGSAQFSLHGPEWTAIAAEKGAPVFIMANVVNGAAVWIAAAPDFKYESPKDFKGQKVVTGQMPTTSTSLFIKLLKENGLSEKDVDMLQVPLGSEPGPLAAGQAKIGVMYEPGLEQVVGQGMKVIVSFPKLYGAYAFSSITARKDVDPDLAQRVANGLEKAMRFMHANEAETVAIGQKEFPKLDAALVAAAVKRMLADGVYPKSVDITPAALKVGLETQIALGNLKAQPDYATFVGKSFIDKAMTIK